MTDKFEHLEISSQLMQSLKEMGFSEPTGIQAESIPHILEGRDCLAQAPTGTGKTCAFGIPAINAMDTDDESVQTLIMCPTRELAMQTELELKKLAQNTIGARVLSVYGGQNMQRQLAGLRKRPQIVVGTPGRIMDHLRRKTLKLDGLRILVLDEADEMLNMGFREDIDTVLKSVKNEHQTLLFSATMPKEILEISKNYQKDPIRIKAAGADEMPLIEQYFVKVEEEKKPQTLINIMGDKAYGLVLVFCRTKRRVDELKSKLKEYCYITEALHGDLKQRERDYVMKRFRGGDINILIATDVAARGIDVDGVEAVFNYDLPENPEYYLHRIGRTARAKRKGASYSFANRKEVNKIRVFERFTGVNMTEIYPFSEEELLKMADKRLDDALKILGSDLGEYMKLIKAKVDNYNENSDAGCDYLEIAAALLKSGLSDVVESSPKPRSAKKTKDVGIRYFLNVGTKDEIEEKDIKEYLFRKGNIAVSDIGEVKLLDTFSFVNLKEGNEAKLLRLNGLKFAGRVFRAEPATASTSTQSGGRKGGYKSDKPADSKNARSYSSSKSGGYAKSSGGGDYSKPKAAKSVSDKSYSKPKSGKSYSKPVGAKSYSKSGSGRRER